MKISKFEKLRNDYYTNFSVTETKDRKKEKGSTYNGLPLPKKTHTTNSTLSQDNIELIQQYAKEDAPLGEFMGIINSKFRTFRKTYILENISPNRAALKAILIKKITTVIGPCFFEGQITVEDVHYPFDISVGAKKYVFAQIYDLTGELLCTYSSQCGWNDVRTSAEQSVYHEISSVYSEAWDLERKKLNLPTQTEFLKTTSSKNINLII